MKAHVYICLFAYGLCTDAFNTLRYAMSKNILTYDYVTGLTYGWRGRYVKRSSVSSRLKGLPESMETLTKESRSRAQCQTPGGTVTLKPFSVIVHVEFIFIKKTVFMFTEMGIVQNRETSSCQTLLPEIFSASQTIPLSGTNALQLLCYAFIY
jgi:hypothetical protein